MFSAVLCLIEVKFAHQLKKTKNKNKLNLNRYKTYAKLIPRDCVDCMESANKNLLINQERYRVRQLVSQSAGQSDSQSVCQPT